MIDFTTLSPLLEKCHCCRIGYYDGEEVYIVPLSFGYALEEDQLVFYLHGAPQGRRYTLTQSHPHVGFELDTDYRLIEGPQAIDYTASFTSIIGNGTLTLIEDPDHKRRGIQALLAHYSGKNDWPIAPHVLAHTAIYRLVIEKISIREK